MPSNKLGIYNNNVFIPYTATTKRSKQIDIKSYITYSIDSQTTGWTVNYAPTIFYADSSNNWRMRINIVMAKDSGSTGSIGGGTLTLAGISFPAFNQAMSGRIVVGTVAQANASSSSIAFDFASSNISIVRVSGDVALSAEPTWASLGTTASAALEGVLAANVFIPSASATESGLITTGAQAIAGPKTFSAGLKLPTSGGTQTTLDYYETKTYSGVKFRGNITGAASTATVDITVTRIGNIVSIYVPTVSITIGAGGDSYISTEISGASPAFLDTRFRPSERTWIPYTAAINGGNLQANPCFALVSSVGDIRIVRDGTGGTLLFVAGTGGSGAPGVITYKV